MYITQKAEDQDNREEKGNELKDRRYIIETHRDKNRKGSK
jgi:hypothetical protein